MWSKRHVIGYAVGAVFALLCALATLGRALVDHSDGAWAGAAFFALCAIGCAIRTVRLHRRDA